MQLLLDYLKIHELSNNPIFIVGNSAKSLFNDLNMDKFKNNQLIFIQHLDQNPINESYFTNYDHQNYLNIDLNFIYDCEYSQESLTIQIQRFFETNKHFGTLTKMNVVLSLDELVGQSFIESLIIEKQNHHLELNLYVKKPKISFKNILIEVDNYFQKCLTNFKNVISIEATDNDKLYSILNN
jgi:hypothetical protein